MVNILGYALRKHENKTSDESRYRLRHENATIDRESRVLDRVLNPLELSLSATRQEQLQIRANTRRNLFSEQQNSEQHTACVRRLSSVEGLLRIEFEIRIEDQNQQTTYPKKHVTKDVSEIIKELSTQRVYARVLSQPTCATLALDPSG